jgi:hypothetical protein
MLRVLAVHDDIDNKIFRPQTSGDTTGKISIVFNKKYSHGGRHPLKLRRITARRLNWI